MEWLVKKSHYVKKMARHVLVLCDSGGSLKMIAEANSMILLSPGDILSPIKDAQYCINREKHQILKIINARCYSCDEWQRLTCKSS
ncbi:signal transduction protein PmrD [Salmonella enterica]|uniref:PmrD n=2 Tax=Salmonella enterica TaxID=28901 RepID=Q5MJU1_SALER|nr:PmrD [Salmonella enterica subsp. VII]EAM7071614.1 signal transduction protein PmrD [Salmonella enterica]EDO5297293.1 signal transduction protein PmrD [Salmonella enterica subsp. houtenae serovar 40:z4,z24:-]EDS6438478.1 signal transduction protein PmrD [Salmonella enterica subsp. VII str. CFSAN000550]EDT6887518.1 signal transduction protein PmrD [Salmonella enterica subsp. enterica]EDU7900340.1 signal transduction protein PmrD [Salmonella enterica subsp. houtenae]QJY65103.1 signal transduc